MPIVLKYGSPGPVLAAGYAAGAGHRMNEQKDDALKVWQQNTQREFQAQQSWLDRYQQNNLQQNAFAQQNQFAKDQRAFQAEQQQNQFGFASTQAGRARQYAAEQGDKTAMRRFNSEEFFRLPPIPEHADAEQRKELTRLRGGIRELIGNTYDPSNPSVREQLQKAMEAYNSGVSALADSYSPAREFNKQTVHVDSKGNAYDTPPEGVETTKYNRRTGQPLVDNSKAQAAQQKQVADQQKQIAEAQKQKATELGAYYKDELKMVDDLNNPKHATPEDAMIAATAKYEAFQRGLGQSTQQTSQTAQAAPPAPPQVAAPQLLTAGVAPAAPVAQPPRQPAAAPPSPPAAGIAPSVPTDPRTGRALGPVKFDIDNLPSNMTQIPQNQRQLYADNMPQHINELPEALRQKYKTSWPRPATPEDAKKLDPGTMFITPEGRIKSVPF